MHFRHHAAIQSTTTTARAQRQDADVRHTTAARCNYRQYSQQRATARTVLESKEVVQVLLARNLRWQQALERAPDMFDRAHRPGRSRTHQGGRKVLSRRRGQAPACVAMPAPRGLRAPRRCGARALPGCQCGSGAAAGPRQRAAAACQVCLVPPAAAPARRERAQCCHGCTA